MLDKILKGIFSMGAMSLALLAFAFSIGYATFVESDYGTPASKIVVFNTTWFEILLVYLSFGLIANIFKYKMYKPEKIAMFAFHLSFLFIILGAGITRYFSFEGMMPIAEGEATNIIYSSDPQIMLKVFPVDGSDGKQLSKKKYLSEYYNNGFDYDFEINNHKPVNIKYVDYLENRVEAVITADSIKTSALEFVIKGETKYLVEGESILLGGEIISFNDKSSEPGIKVFFENGKLKIQSIKPFSQVNMSKLKKEDRARNFLDSSAVNNIPADTAVDFYSGRLYNFTAESLMFRELKTRTARTRTKSKVQDEGVNYVVIDVTQGEKTERIELPYKNGTEMNVIPFQFNDMNIIAGYGPAPIALPFYVRCNDFQLDKYAGSTMPSSFASEVTVIDSVNGVNRDQRIFMNNVMDFKGYRFFQSNYFPDETGTMLSVNFDWWGTNITYLGYLLMSIGMVLSLFAYTGRFRDLNRGITKSRNKRATMLTLAVIFSLGFSSNSYAQYESVQQEDHAGHNHAPGEHVDEDDHAGHNHETKAVGLETKTAGVRSKKKIDLPEDFKFQYISEKHAEELSTLLIQDYGGRIIPFHTMADKLLRKIHRANTYEGHNAVQVIMGMHLAGPYWVDKKIIFVSNKIRSALGVKKYVSLDEISDENRMFLWTKEYEVAHNKPDSKKSEYDKEIVRLGERFNILSQILQYRHFRVIPIQNDINNTWLWPFLSEVSPDDKVGMELASNYLHKAWLSTDSKAEEVNAIELLTELKKYQRENAKNELPTASKVDLEITYNELNIFKSVQTYYLLIGFVLLIVFFVRVLLTPTHNRERIIKMISIPLIVLLALVFVYHGIGLAFRWNISGHAPWSNGYEAIVFIAWASVLAGFLFSRKNGAILAATAVLAALILFVSELNLLDPEISQLQPVLKSYWLMIHVAVITASYGFLGLGAILAFFNLTLYFFRGKENGKRLSMNINEITSVIEMTMTIGLFMLTIGTFLGGIWANESWGRYWGWDPKETWALVSVLTYAIILHLRYIPGAKDKFVFNLVSFWGYASILFTFFGVNFKLTGLHSYAQGEGTADTPTWVWVTVFVFAVYSIASGVAYFLYKNKKKEIK